MTDNEKRAHEFALAAMQIITKEKLKEPFNGEAERQIDLYEYYQKSYDQVLKRLNQDFPEKP